MSSDSVSFRAHRSMLWHASTHFAATIPEAIITVETTDGADCQAQPPLVTVELPEQTPTVKILLKFCYPVADPSFPSLSTLAAVTDAAFKYDIKRAQTACIHALLDPDMLSTSPFDVYAVVHRHKLARETRVAADNTLKYPVHWASPMPSQLGTVNGSAVYELIRYRERCRASALRTVRDSEWWDTLGDVHYYPCFSCDPDAEENESTRQYPLEVEDCLRITHRLIAAHPCRSEALRDKILANLMALAPCDRDFLSLCRSGDCRERVVNALLSVHREVMTEIDHAIREVRELPANDDAY